MGSYTLFIHDTRYSVPTLAFVDTVDTEDADEACQVAQIRLVESTHHVSVEVVAAGATLFVARRAKTKVSPSALRPR